MRAVREAGRKGCATEGPRVHLRRLAAEGRCRRAFGRGSSRRGDRARRRAGDRDGRGPRARARDGLRCSSSRARPASARPGSCRASSTTPGPPISVFHGHAHPFERTRPFGVVAAALGLHRRAPDPARRRSVPGWPARARPPNLPATSGSRSSRRSSTCVETSCTEQPVLLVAEDVHWADTASLSAISSVARQLPLSPVLVVVTARPSPLSTEAARLLDDLSAAGARTLATRAAGTRRRRRARRSHARRTSRARADRAPWRRPAGIRSGPWRCSARSTTTDCCERTGQRVEATTSDLPASLHALVVRRLRHLPNRPGSCCRSRRCSATTCRSATSRPWRAGRRPRWSRNSAKRSTRSCSTRRTTGSCSATRSCTTRSISNVPAPSRRLLHREAADALTAAGADRLDVAGHLMLGAERGDEQAIAALRDCRA